MVVHTTGGSEKQENPLYPVTILKLRYFTFSLSTVDVFYLIDKENSLRFSPT